jgi:LPS-assembly lipoprotein
MKSMSFMKAGRLFQASLLLVSALALAACGFHLRQSAALPPAMKRVHLNVSGGVGSNLQRELARVLQVSGVTIEDESGHGIAELNVPTAAFGTETLTLGGYSLITEYAVHYQVRFDLIDPEGKTLVPLQSISMSREYSYDATQTIGNASEVQEIQGSLTSDMVQAILFRLQAAGKRELAAPSAAGSTAAPASASTSATSEVAVPATASSAR